ncbi:MAG: OmpA family protein [Pseudomonadales bacterium]|nr:OmpA family protein [Pseudomonadales bacterium]
MAELRPTRLEDRRLVQQLQHKISVYQSTLQDLQSQGLNACLPAAENTLYLALTRAQRELHAGLIYDADAQLRFVNRQLLYTVCALDTLHYHTACGVNDTADQHKTWEDLPLRAGSEFFGNLRQYTSTAHYDPGIIVNAEPELTLVQTAMLQKNWQTIPGLKVCQALLSSSVTITRRDAVVRERTEASGLIVEIIFDFGEFKLKPIYQLALQRMAEYLLNHRQDALYIAAHADDVGSIDSNRLLSQHRAETVVNFLTNRGVKNSQLQLEAFGESEPRQNNADIEGRQLNRRVNMTILHGGIEDATSAGSMAQREQSLKGETLP